MEFYVPVVVYHIRSFAPLLVAHTARPFVEPNTYVLFSDFSGGGVLRHTFRLSSWTKSPKLLLSIRELCEEYGVSVAFGSMDACIYV